MNERVKRHKTNASTGTYVSNLLSTSGIFGGPQLALSTSGDGNPETDADILPQPVQ